MRKLFAVVNAQGKAFAGSSSLSGRARWIDYADDTEYLSAMQACRWKRDARWLALALKSDATARWIEV